MTISQPIVPDLEDVEVDCLVVRLRGDDARGVGVPHHDVSVGPHGDAALHRGGDGGTVELIMNR